MNNNDNEEANLDSALKKFINAMRLFILTEMKVKYGDIWERKYFETLNEHQQKIWSSNRLEVKYTHELIDFGNLSGFAKKTKFFNDIVRNGWKYFTKFNDINEGRNMRAHYGSFDKVKSDLAFAQMISIAKELQMNELKEHLKKLQNNHNNKGESAGEITFLNNEHKNLIKHNSKKRPKIKRVINLIYDLTGINVNKSTANLSTINANGIYSVEPNFERKKNNWYLILINTQKKIVYVFNIPTNNSIYDKLYKRDDKQVFRLLFDVDDLCFREQLSHERLDKFLLGECKYNHDATIF